jgi:hypothetical protein
MDSAPYSGQRPFDFRCDSMQSSGMDTESSKTWLFAEHPSEVGRWFCVHLTEPGLIASLSKDTDGRFRVNVLRWLNNTPSQEGASQVVSSEQKEQVLREAERAARVFRAKYRSAFNVGAEPDSAVPKWIVGPELYLEGDDSSPLYAVHTEEPCFVVLTEKQNNAGEVINVRHLESGLQPDKALLEEALDARKVLMSRWMDEIKMLIDGNILIS